MRIPVLLIEPSAFFHDLIDFAATSLDGFFVGCDCIFAMYRAFRSGCSGAFGVEVVRQDGEDLAGMLGGEFVPELVDGFLRCLLLDLEALAGDCGLLLLFGSHDGGSSGLLSCDVHHVNV